MYTTTMATSGRQDRRIQAQEAVKRAMDGDLPQLNTYSLVGNKNRYSLTVPPEGVRNFPVGKGDDLPAFVDFENGFVVYDLHGTNQTDER